MNNNTEFNKELPPTAGDQAEQFAKEVKASYEKASEELAVLVGDK
jgi:hypothetical protein